MIIVKLQGGLGNQMFQYAAARTLINNNEVVYFDTDFFKKYTVSNSNFTARKYELDIFKNIKATEASAYYENLFNSNNLLFKLRRKSLTSSTRYIRQQENKYVSFEDVHQFKYVYLDGYFQSEKYFKHIRNDLLNEFTFPSLDEKNDVIKQKIESSTNAVSVHIRRGDYLKPIFTDVHGILPVEYYYQSLNCLDKQIHDKSLFIFSDDIEWVKENFKCGNVNVHFIENNKEAAWKDMALMSECKHHIIANSSFSWWGAWLSKKEGKVFAPCNWFNAAKMEFNILDFIPESWNIVQYE